MHLKFGYFVLKTSIYQLTERKTFIMYKTGWCENRLCARAHQGRQRRIW